MLKHVAKGADALLEHYLLALMVLGLAVLTLGGLGVVTVVGVIGLVLCIAGLFQGETTVDLWVLIPLGVYLVLGCLSNYMTFGQICRTYPATQPILLVFYLLMARLDGREQLLFRRLSVLWAGVVAAHGVGLFLFKSLEGTAGRLSGLLANANPMGIFLVMAWFTLASCLPGEEERGPLSLVLRHLEPLLLTALALTLSMGSFVALAAGMAFLAAGWLRHEGWRTALERTCRMLAKAALAVGLGILMYFTARRTGIPWFCFVLAVYLLALMALWEKLDRFLRDLPQAAAVMTVGGALVALAAVAIRPSALATFADRVGMMRNGLRYILVNPLLGVGPNQWRGLNMMDSDPYFGTWHIHNIPIHIAVELGLPALAALVFIVVRTYRKKGSNRAGFTAFLVHSMMDTGFFYLGVLSFLEISVAEPQKGGTRLNPWVVRGLLAALGLFFLNDIYGFL